MRTRDQRGVTLIEILISMVIISVVITSLFAALATSSKSSKTHRQLVAADAVLRDYAEAAKTAARSCTSGGTFSVTAPSPLPTGYSVNTLTSQSCPAVLTTATLTLTVTISGGPSRSMAIKVRTP